jgi:hypothetical protein
MKKINILGLIAVLSISLAASAESPFAMKVEDKDIPSEISDDVKAQLVPKVHQISGEGDPFFEFWFAKTVELSAIADTTKDSLENLDEIALLGVLVVHDNEERFDFREDPIDPGTYVLRMCLQPQDGNHMGTSPFDTFAILIPVDRDEEVLESNDPEDMVEIASEKTIAEHPPILSLQPREQADGEFPRLTHNEEEEWHFLTVLLPATSEGKETQLPLNLVFEGLGDL